MYIEMSVIKRMYKNKEFEQLNFIDTVKNRVINYSHCKYK